jgi:hypothetical protein
MLDVICDADKVKALELRALGQLKEPAGTALSKHD